MYRDVARLRKTVHTRHEVLSARVGGGGASLPELIDHTKMKSKIVRFAFFPLNINVH